MISRIWNAYCFETAKAFRRGFTYLGMLLVVLAILCTPLLRPVEGHGTNVYTFIAFAMPSALNLLGLLMLMMYCAGLLSSEVGSGSVCMVLVRPIKRYEFVLAKLWLGMTYAVMLSGAAAISSWSMAYMLGRPLGVEYGGEMLYTHHEMLLDFIYGLLLGLLPQFATAAYALMISSLTRSTGAAIGSAVGIAVVVELIKHPLHIAPFLFSTYLEAPWSVFAAQCDGMMASWFPMVWYLVGSSLGAFILFTGIAMVALSRRNIHA